MSDACVVIRFKMLAYYRVRSAFESNHALVSNIIWGSKTDLDKNPAESRNFPFISGCSLARA